MDGDKYFAKDANKSKTSGDAVSGFTLHEIERAFASSTTWSELKNYLKKNYPANGTRKYTSSAMDSLFNYWSK